ncbi:hypothetical protein Tsubulata_035320 [Turnera subulata]|uniref:NAD-dependent epimerase/dehydratase domain-containing protein n=1 Tax=Turnera subulata TaxID=218843 RepID=A0A9Q0G0K6_9ROSI|nr:hypothetical protein Tsubulata_035320 [Turnera subulata]
MNAQPVKHINFNFREPEFGTTTARYLAMEAPPRHLPARFPARFGHFPRTVTVGQRRKPTFLLRAASYPQTDKLESNSGNRMFVLGLGFVGQFFAQNLLKEKNWNVTGTCTSVRKKKELEEKGFDVCIFDANELQLSVLNTLKCYTHLLVSVPPVSGVGDPILRYGELVRGVLMDGNLQWLGYLSSTSVYGDCGGAWVDEDYPTNPASEAAKSRLTAEEGWLNLGHDLGISSQVFRLGGIYGPGRRLCYHIFFWSKCVIISLGHDIFGSAVDTVIKQQPLSSAQKLRTSKQYTSRVHVEDICQALMASLSKPSSGRIYNIVDDEPAPREEVFAYAKELVDKKWPGHIKQFSSSENVVPSIQKVRSGGEKRVSNERMKRELGVRLCYPSYTAGLQSIVNQMENPFQCSS